MVRIVTYTPVEGDEGKEVAYFHDSELIDGTLLRVIINDVIVTETHPMGHTITAPSLVVATAFARWDVLVTHMMMKDSLTGQTEKEDES